MSPSVRSRKVKSRIPKPTSGHLKVEIIIRPLDTKKKIRTIKVSRGRFRNSRFHCPHAPSSTREACKIYWFSLCFQHIKKFEAISKHRPLTGQGLEALFYNSPKKFNVCQLDFTDVSKITNNGTADVPYILHEQRHRRRTYVLKELLTRLGLQALFFKEGKLSLVS